MKLSEHNMCKEITNWARLNESRYPVLRWLRHWPNEGKRNPWLAKEVGIIAGPSDYFLPAPTDKYSGLWLEVKTPKNKPTQAQARWIEDMRSLGYQAEWVDTLKSAFMILDRYAQDATAYWKRGARG